MCTERLGPKYSLAARLYLGYDGVDAYREAKVLKNSSNICLLKNVCKPHYPECTAPHCRSRRSGPGLGLARPLGPQVIPPEDTITWVVCVQH